MPPDPQESLRLWRSKSRLPPTFPVRTSTSKLIASTDMCVFVAFWLNNFFKIINLSVIFASEDGKQLLSHLNVAIL